MSYWPLLVCLVATWYFVGLIWIIQVVQYPLFALVGQDTFARFHEAHSRRITLVLGLPFLLTFGSALLMFWVRPTGVPFWSVLLNLLLAVSVWVITALIHVPLHSSLGRAYSLRTMQSLIDTNWLRTAVWTAQGLLLLWMIANALHTFT